MWVFATVTIDGDGPMKNSLSPGEIKVSYQVGYFHPNGTFQREYEFLEKESAAQRVSWLNGGDGYPIPK
jgi:hypothetical protein